MKMTCLHFKKLEIFFKTFSITFILLTSVPLWYTLKDGRFEYEFISTILLVVMISIYCVMVKVFTDFLEEK